MINMKEKMEELVKKIASDKELREKFLKNPIGVIEELTGLDLPNDQLEKLADGIKAKLAADSLGDTLSGLGKIFGK